MQRFSAKVNTAGALLAAALACPAAAVGQQCPPSWSAGFPAGDFDGTVRAIAGFDDGSGPTFYAGGGFTRAGGVTGRGVVRWTGSAWERVGSEFDGEVYALAVHTAGASTSLYAAGSFRTIGGSSAPLVARWTGQAWVPVGVGLGGAVVRALASYTDSWGTYLVAGGESLGTSGGGSSGTARWNGSNWQTMDSASFPQLRVYALATIQRPTDQLLVCGGRFSSPSSNLNNVAQWAGNRWDPIGTGTNGAVHALAAHDDGSGMALFVGGEFTVAGGVAANRLARLNGTAWSPLGSGADGAVRSLLSFDTDGPFGNARQLYAGGEFRTIGGTTAPFLARWDGFAWSGLGAEPNDAVVAIGGRTGGLGAIAVGGSFSAIGGTPASRIAQYTQAGWTAMANPAQGSSPSEQVRAIEPFDADGPGPEREKLYIAGDFNTIGSLAVPRIAAWDGAAWSSPPRGTDGPILVLKAVGANVPGGPGLLVGGAFTNTGGDPASRIARWDGSAWSALGAGLSGTVETIEVFGNPPSIYAGGTGLLASGTTGIARWNGTAWVSVGSGVFATSVLSLAAFDDGVAGPALYAAGDVWVSGGTPNDGIARWNGSAWSRVGTPVWAFQPSISSLKGLTTPGGRTLYAGGAFQSLSPLGYSVLARWNGSTWSLAPSDPGVGWPISLAVHDDGGGPAIYAAGPFTSVGGLAASGIARWTGSGWAPLSAGLRVGHGAARFAAATFDDDGPGPIPPALYVGGQFTAAGGQSSGRLARWGRCVCYANCDGSTVPPVLNIADFICFQTRFAAADPLANCDGSTVSPVLNVADFICFQTAFAQGCP